MLTIYTTIVTFSESRSYLLHITKHRQPNVFKHFQLPLALFISEKRNILMGD